MASNFLDFYSSTWVFRGVYEVFFWVLYLMYPSAGTSGTKKVFSCGFSVRFLAKETWPDFTEMLKQNANSQV